jgi:hypothetical protein
MTKNGHLAFSSTEVSLNSSCEIHGTQVFSMIDLIRKILI